MKALSIRQPWVYAIFELGKDVENRDWPTRFRGTVAIHASKSFTRADYNDLYFAVREMPGRLWEILPSFENLNPARGAVVGTVDIVDCVKDSHSPWFFGDYGFMLANIRPLLEPVPCKGALSFWDVPQDVFNKMRFAE